MRPLSRLLMTAWRLALLAAAAAAHGGEWTAEMPGGLRLVVVQDAARVREGYVLERRYPDGRPDAQFGDEGRVVFSLGPDNAGPAALRVDAQGRAWIAGASQGGDGRLQAVLLRFGSDGRPDGSFGAQGRVATAPAGREARATDVLPLDDGSAWVAGAVLDAQGGERSGVWRVRADGRIDPAFGLGGLWADPGGGDADVGGFERGPDGELALGLRRLQGGQAQLELWTWRPGGVPQRQSAERVDAARVDAARLVRRDGRWGWSVATTPLAAPAPSVAASQPAAPLPEAPAAALAPPFAHATRQEPAASAAAPPAAAGASAWWWVLLPGGGLLGWWWQRRRAHPL